MNEQESGNELLEPGFFFSLSLSLAPAIISLFSLQVKACKN